MKRIFTVALVVVAVLMTSAAGAQMKIGYISVDAMVGLMPETARLDTLMAKYQSDSLGTEYNYMINEYQRKDSMYRDTVHVPSSVRKKIGDELPDLISQIQNWQTIAQQKSEAKQNELLRPIYNKVYDAIKAVAKEKGYTHVFNKEAFLVAPEGDDMILLVAQKLKVNVPPPANKPTGIIPKTGN
jgi:outer membrane protein